MKHLILILALCLSSLHVFAQAAPAEINFETDVALPLNGVNVVRLYERSGPATAYVYTRVAEVPVASTGTTGTITVTFAKVQVPADGILRTYVARTAGTATLPTATATLIGESADSNIATLTIAPGSTTGPKQNRITVITLK